MNPYSGNKPIILFQGDVACVPAQLPGAAFRFPAPVRSNPPLPITGTARPLWPTLLFTFLLGMVLLGGRLRAGESVPTLSTVPLPQAGEDRLQWWRDAKFGLFIHWGPASLSGKEISWARIGHPHDHPGLESIPASEYDQLYRKFNPEKFDADAWIRLAREAGMKYVVFVAKHHDGFSLWPTRLRPDYSITATPFPRDLCREIADAAHRHGLRLGWYYSTRDWTHPDYLVGDNRRYNSFYEGQVQELFSQYGKVDIAWFDHVAGNWSDYTFDRLFRMLNQLQPGILVNDRAARFIRPTQDQPTSELAALVRGDFDTPEQRIGKFQNDRAWESCVTMTECVDGGGWSYRSDGRTRRLDECLRMLVSCVSGDGNLLLNIGPLPSGEIVPEQVTVLKQLGGWLGKYGESIYATRGGPFRNGQWGGATFRDRLIYLHVFQWQGDALRLPALKGKVLKAEVLTGGSATWEQTTNGFVIRVPPENQDPVDTIIKLELSTPVKEEFNQGEPLVVAEFAPVHLMSRMSSPRPVPASRVMPGVGDYTFLSWSDGWLNGAPRKPGLICLQTGQYGAVFDPWRASLTHLGKVAAPLTYEEAGAMGPEELFHLPKAELNLEVHTAGSVYRCIRAAANTADWLNFPVRIIESGRYLQHWDILQLHFEDDQGNVLPATGRLDVVAWPDMIYLTLEVIPSKDLAVTEVKLRMRSTAFGNHESVSSAEKAPAGSRLQAGLLVSPSHVSHVPAGRGQAKEIMTGKVVPIEMDRELQALRVALPCPDWSVAREPDRLERYALELDNPADAPQTFHLVFDSTNGTPGITGITAMLRDAEGHPTGIPVQMSKNWHRQSNRRFLYEGPWLHAATLLHLPPRSKVSLELALCWARWGGVPAASHAQLCLVGWGWNQLWDEVAIGSWGESICYEPEAIQQRCRIDDVRPLMVWGMNGKEQRWTWTHNVGGGDFLVYYDEENRYQPWRGVRATYLSQGPNLTDVLYSGTTADGAIACQVRVSTPRCDDINRAYHRIRYDVLKSAAFRRLAFYQLGSDNYHWHQYDLLARGHAGGMIEEWNPGRGGTRYLRAGIPCEGEAPWFSLHAALPQDNAKPVAGAWATRGLIIRAWKARLGGRETPAVAAVYGTEAGRIPSANLELVPPTNITRLQPGDFVEAEVELVILPHAAEDYYGPNQNLKASLAGAANTWKPVLRQAKGNHVQLSVRSGRILRRYPPVLAVDQDEFLDFDITGGCGYVPITVAGLKDYRGYELLLRHKGELTVIDQSVHGQDFWQTDWEAASGRWRRTYNVCLDSPGDAAQTKGFVFRNFAQSQGLGSLQERLDGPAQIRPILDLTRKRAFGHFPDQSRLERQTIRELYRLTHEFNTICGSFAAGLHRGKEPASRSTTLGNSHAVLGWQRIARCCSKTLPALFDLQTAFPTDSARQLLVCSSKPYP